jgi:alanyl-tRNA synthetase
MSAADVRSSFLEFFRGQSHIIVPSSPLAPANDPTLLFTNAGMVQFKDVFLGKEQRDYLRAASAQRWCVPEASTTISRTSATPRAKHAAHPCLKLRTG